MAGQATAGVSDETSRISPQRHTPPILPSVVRLWTVDVAAVDADRLVDLLPADERARAAGIASREARTRFVAARATLRAALAELTGAEADSFEFVAGPHGKPRLGDGPRFNLSHSGGLALVAIAMDRDVGVDVEEIRPRARLDAIARRCFSPAEHDALTRCPADDRLQLFYDTWTAREALAKATGRGLAAETECFERFSLLRLSPADGYSGALVAGGEGWRAEHCALPEAIS